MSGYARSLLLRPSVAVFGCEWIRTNQFLLFVWAGDNAKRSGDFLAVPDADSKSPHYGQAVASVAVPGPSGTPHHTELEMPEGGFLLANAFESGPPCCSICARLQVHRRDLAQVHSKPFPFRSPEGRVALVIEVEKARYTKLTFEHTPPH